MDGTERFPLFQTGSGRAVSVSVASVQKAKSVLKDNNTSDGELLLFCYLNSELTLLPNYCETCAFFGVLMGFLSY